MKKAKKEERYKDLRLTYIQHECAAASGPHWDLHYEGKKNQRNNLCCISCSDIKNKGIELIKEMIKEYNIHTVGEANIHYIKKLLRPLIKHTR